MIRTDLIQSRFRKVSYRPGLFPFGLLAQYENIRSHGNMNYLMKNTVCVKWLVHMNSNVRNMVMYILIKILIIIIAMFLVKLFKSVYIYIFPATLIRDESLVDFQL